MAKKSEAKSSSAVGRKSLEPKSDHGSTESRPTSQHSLARRTGEGRGEGRPSSLLDTRVVYCGDNLEQLAKLPDACVDLIYIDPPKPMQKEKCRMMKPARFPILHSSFRLLHLPHYHCDWHASHYVKVRLN
jgi:hypothetical protein